jgi:hypothetical protein
MLMVIMPAHMQVSWQLVSSAGRLAMVTVGVPGVQGAGSTGMQGAGVGVPSAAAVAAITAGLLGLEHMPNGITLSMGMWSMIVAAGVPPAVTRLTGSTVSDEGATPKLQASTAPEVTSGVDMGFPLSG